MDFLQSSYSLGNLIEVFELIENIEKKNIRNLICDKLVKNIIKNVENGELYFV